MKYLKIEDNKGYYLKDFTDPESWEEIDKINKDDLLKLLNIVITDDFEMDLYDENKLANKAHQIIYKNIHEKFSAIYSQKNKFKDESELLYRDAIDKYSVK